MARKSKVSKATKSLRRAISTPTFAALAGGALGAYVLPKYTKVGFTEMTGALTGASVAVLVTALI